MAPRTYEQLLKEIVELREEKLVLLKLLEASGGNDKWYAMLTDLIKAITKDVDECPAERVKLTRTHKLLNAWTP